MAAEQSRKRQIAEDNPRVTREGGRSNGREPFRPGWHCTAHRKRGLASAEAPEALLPPALAKRPHGIEVI
jgi:hypothetical protein